MANYGKLVAAMESEGAIGGAGTDEDAVAAAETATEVEQTSSETNEVANNVTEVDTGIGNAAEAAEGLAEVQDTVAEKVESGEGMTESEAEFAEMAVEAYCKMVGISAKKSRIFPTMENFGGKGSRLRATKLVLEGISDTLKTIWEAIKAAIARAIEMVKSFFNGFIKSRESLEKHYNNLEQRLSDLPSNAKKNKDSFSTCAALFTYDGKSNKDTIKTILEGSNSLLVSIPSAVTDVTSMVQKGYELAATQSVSNGDWGAKMSEAIVKIAKETSTGGTARTAKDGADGSVTITENCPLVDNHRLVVQHTAAKENGTPKLKVSIEKSEIGSKDLSSSITAPDAGEMKDILKQGRNTLKLLREHDRTSGLAIKAMENMKKHADDMIKISGEIKVAATTDTSKQSDEKEKARKMSTIVKDMTSTLLEFAAKAPNYVFKAAKGAADYVAAGMSNMKVENKN